MSSRYNNSSFQSFGGAGYGEGSFENYNQSSAYGGSSSFVSANQPQNINASFGNALQSQYGISDPYLNNSYHQNTSRYAGGFNDHQSGYGGSYQTPYSGYSQGSIYPQSHSYGSQYGQQMGYGSGYPNYGNGYQYGQGQGYSGQNSAYGYGSSQPNYGYGYQGYGAYEANRTPCCSGCAQQQSYGYNPWGMAHGHQAGYGGCGGCGGGMMQQQYQKSMKQDCGCGCGGSGGCGSSKGRLTPNYPNKLRHSYITSGYGDEHKQMVYDPVSDSAPYQSQRRITYQPFTRKYIEYQDYVNFIPVHKSNWEYQKVMKQIDFVPQEYYESNIEYEPREVIQQRLNYLPIEQEIVHVPQQKMRRVNGMTESKRKVHLVHNEDSRLGRRMGSKRVETRYEIEGNGGELNNSGFSNLINSNRLNPNVSQVESTVQMVPKNRLEPILEPPVMSRMPQKQDSLIYQALGRNASQRSDSALRESGGEGNGVMIGGGDSQTYGSRNYGETSQFQSFGPARAAANDQPTLRASSSYAQRQHNEAGRFSSINEEDHSAFSPESQRHSSRFDVRESSELQHRNSNNSVGPSGSLVNSIARENY